MSVGTDGKYWETRNLPSALKHALLSRYIPRFGGKTGSQSDGGRVVYLDGYAGEGRYQSGEEGSAAIALRVALDQQSHLRWTLLFAERKQQARTQLKALVTEYRAQGVDATVYKEADEALDAALRRAVGVPLFLFLDPCGLGLPFDRLVAALRMRQLRWPPTEFLLNFSLQAVNRLAGNDRSVNGNEASGRRVDAACGGGWWREYFEQGLKSPAERVADEYCRRLSQATGRSVLPVPVRRAPHQKPIYDLVFGTASPHGLWVFGDALAAARNVWWQEVEDKEEENEPGALFPRTLVLRPDPEDLNRAAVPVIADNIDRLLATRRSVVLGEFPREVFGDYYGEVTETVVRKAVKLMHAQGRTPTEGKGPIPKMVVQAPTSAPGTSGS
jgi:three-Cys-motif partner protein